MVRMRLDVQR